MNAIGFAKAAVAGLLTAGPLGLVFAPATYAAYKRAFKDNYNLFFLAWTGTGLIAAPVLIWLQIVAVNGIDSVTSTRVVINEDEATAETTNPTPTPSPTESSPVPTVAPEQQAPASPAPLEESPSPSPSPAVPFTQQPPVHSAPLAPEVESTQEVEYFTQVLKENTPGLMQKIRMTQLAPKLYQYREFIYEEIRDRPRAEQEVMIEFYLMESARETGVGWDNETIVTLSQGIVSGLIEWQQRKQWDQQQQESEQQLQQLQQDLYPDYPEYHQPQQPHTDAPPSQLY